MAEYDFIIAGGGVAGLALAYEMISSPLRGQSILIVDRQPPERAARSWGYWTDQPGRLDHLVTRRWDSVELIGDSFRRALDIAPYQYHLIRSSDYFQAMREALQDAPGVQFIQARVDEVGDVNDRSMARVIIDGVPHGARWVFDSTYTTAEILEGPSRYHYLRQHFKSWEIETPSDRFDPRRVTLFDLRTPQKGCLRYFTILPYTRRRAWITYTVFSAAMLKPHEYDRAISEYLESMLEISAYRTGAIETGVVPITDRAFPRKLSERVMSIGTRGGMVRPTLASAFPRILRDARAVTESLINYGNPFQVATMPSSYRLYDSLLLRVMLYQGDRVTHLLGRVFRTRPIHSIFAFLDETASLGETTRLITALPAEPFIKALFRVK